MDKSNYPDEQGTQTGQKKIPPQVEKMLASAKEMESVLTRKLTKIDAVSLEKSEMAKQEATKIKSDVEEIKRLSLIHTKEGEDALKAKIIEVNQRIEATTRKAAELQERAVDAYKQVLDEIRALTNETLNALALKEKNISKEDADLVLNRVLTFEKHAALRTEYALKVLEEIRKVVKMKVDVCRTELTQKGELLTKVEYCSKLLNSLCPGTVRPRSPCPAEVVRRKKRPVSQ